MPVHTGIAPDNIGVLYPHHRSAESTHHVRMVTWLFRTSSHLPASLELARNRAKSADVLNVISAGCSNGAEVDSLLATHQLLGYTGKLSITGYDANLLALKWANSGHYLLSRRTSQEFTEETQQEHKALTGAGFHVKRREGGWATDRGKYYVDVWADEVRAGHDVRFLHQDLCEPLPEEQEQANLACVNHVLLHMPQPEAIEALANIADKVSDGGVLSLGIYGFNTNPDTDETHAERSMSIIVLLGKEFGMKQIYVPSHPEIIAFGRPELHT